MTTLRRPRHPMPAFMRVALTERKLMEAYRQRPAYQQNDYVWWVGSAKREATRLKQMLEELAGGKLYMNMKWAPQKRPAKRGG